ncbi:MAG: aminoglycoside phosphotransferase family protein [Candidatus Tectomicrobia bacterium]|uniref:Aminoglycoside phosphotransferase family protein n=1 Tax=Tectimicrobiota bacterium TaxID=2528274 RepID=A0A932CLC0_UNCTE|nr:aminoglycoside phosphotransferase family protein [Candidatus Tectomicrobia bacterium]
MILDVEEGAKALLELIQTHGATPPRWRAKVLSQVQARMVVQYSLYREDSPPECEPFLTLIGKFYADETGRQTYQVMQILAQILSRMQAPPLLAIPQALFYDPRRYLIFQQRVEGVPYGELLNRRDSRNCFRLAGKALAFLHSQKVPVGEEKWMGDHLRELIHPHPSELHEQIPSYRPRVEGLIQSMTEKERTWKEEIEVAPLHRDFHLRQLFYGQGRVWLIDWDLFARGDPALDLGNFLVYLKTHLTQRGSPSIDAFLEGYFSDRPSSILKRVPLYEAFTYLRLACKRFRLKGDHWEEKVNEMLLRSERCLMEESIHEKV